jgi:hypothetical protein
MVRRLTVSVRYGLGSTEEAVVSWCSYLESFDDRNPSSGMEQFKWLLSTGRFRHPVISGRRDHCIEVMARRTASSMLEMMT